MPEFDRERARKAGIRSGEVRRARAGPLKPAEVDAALRPMDSPDNIRLNLERIQAWSCSGRVSAGNAGAAVRACGEALKALELRTELEGLAELRIRLDALDAERKRPRLA